MRRVVDLGRKWCVWGGCSLMLWGVLGCGGVYEALAPGALSEVEIALWPDTLRQGSATADALLLLDLPQSARLRINGLSTDPGLEVLSLRDPSDEACQAQGLLGAVPARFVERDPLKFCLQLQISPTTSTGAKRLRLTLKVNDVAAAGETDLFVLQAVQ